MSQQAIFNSTGREFITSSVMMRALNNKKETTARAVTDLYFYPNHYDHNTSGNAAVMNLNDLGSISKIPYIAKVNTVGLNKKLLFQHFK